MYSIRFRASETGRAIGSASAKNKKFHVASKICFLAVFGTVCPYADSIFFQCSFETETSGSRLLRLPMGIVAAKRAMTTANHRQHQSIDAGRAGRRW